MKKLLLLILLPLLVFADTTPVVNDQTLQGNVSGATAPIKQVPIQTVGVPKSVIICGADPTGVSDSTSAIQSCLNSNNAVVFPTGTYLVSSTLSYGISYGVLIFDNALLQASGSFPANNYVLNLSGHDQRIYYPRIDGANVASGLEMTSFKTHIFTPDIKHFSGNGLAYQNGGNDNFVYDPYIQQWTNSDSQWNNDANFTANGVYVNQADSFLIGGVTRWSGVNLYFDAGAGTFWVIGHHTYAGRNAGNPRIDPINVHVATNAGQVHFETVYFDTGHVDLYSPIVTFRDCYLLQTTAATFTDNNYVRVYANGQAEPYQLSLGFLSLDLGTVNAIAYLPNGANSWSGDWSGLPSVVNGTSWQDMHGASSEVFLYNHVDQSIPDSNYYKPGGIIDWRFQIGSPTGSNLQFTNTSGYFDQFWNIGQGLNLTTNVGNPITSPFWGTNGLALSGTGRTLQDTTSSGTIAAEAAAAIPLYAFSATNPITITDMSTLFLPIPTIGTNVTATNYWSLYANGGIFAGQYIKGLGGETLGTPTGGNLGAGTINISSGYFLNGVPVISSSAFSSITSGTNTAAAMVVGTGSSLGVSGTGSIFATTGTGSELFANVKSYGAKGDGATDDHVAFSNAMAAVNSAWATGTPATLYMPAGIYYLNGPITQCAYGAACRIMGDGQYHTFVDLGASFSGPTFSWDDAWSGIHTGGGPNGCTHSQPSYNFPPNGCSNGPEAKDFTIAGAIASTGQSGLVFYDRNDHVLVENVTVHYLNGYGLNIGVTKNKNEAYMRESNFYNFKVWDSGSPTGAEIHIGSVTDVNGCDATNEVRFWGLDTENSFGDGIVIDTNYTGAGCAKGTDNLMFFGARSEKGASNNDLVRIGGSPIPVTNANNGAPAAFSFLCATNPCSLTGLNIDSTSQVGNQPSDIVTITGTPGGTATITIPGFSYTTGDTYLITATDNATYFTLQTLFNTSGAPAGTPVHVTTGTITGLTFSLNAGTVYNVYFAGLENTTVPTAGFGLHFTSQPNNNSNAANNQYGMVVDGYNAVTGTGVGIQVDGGKSVAIKSAKLTGTLSTQLVVASTATTGCCIYVENLGGSALTTTIDASATGNVFTTGTNAANGWGVDLTGNIFGNSITTATGVANTLKGPTTLTQGATISGATTQINVTANNTNIASSFGVETVNIGNTGGPSVTNILGTVNVNAAAATNINLLTGASSGNMNALTGSASGTGAFGNSASTMNFLGTMTFGSASAQGITFFGGASSGNFAVGAGTGSGTIVFGNSGNTGKTQLQGLSTGTAADVICLTAGGVVILQALGSCTISSEWFKHDIVNYVDNPIDKIDKLVVVKYSMDELGLRNRDMNFYHEQIGMTAENVASVEPDCGYYEQDMKSPQSYRNECISALLVKATQQQHREVSAQADQIKRLWYAIGVLALWCLSLTVFMLVRRRVTP